MNSCIVNQLLHLSALSNTNSFMTVWPDNGALSTNMVEDMFFIQM